MNFLSNILQNPRNLPYEMIPVNNMDRSFKEPILNRLKGIGHITYKKLNTLSLLVRNFFKSNTYENKIKKFASL